jgi:hypothetical protein
MMQHATYWDEASEEQNRAPARKRAATLVNDATPPQVKEKRILGLSEEAIAKLILVITGSTWIGWLLSALWPVSGTF